MTADLPYDDIVWACTNLCELLEVENEALAVHDVQTVKELAENKAALARIYEQSILPMSEDPSLADELSAEEKEELIALGEALKELVEANARALRANVDAANMVMDALVRVAKENSTEMSTYEADGTFRSRSEGNGNSLAFNDEL